MGDLEHLYENLPHGLARYKACTSIPWYVGCSPIDIVVTEAIEVMGPEEIFLLAKTPKGTTLAFYIGRASSMKETLTALRLPHSYPQNLGDRVLYRFKGDLSAVDSEVAALMLEVVGDHDDQFYRPLQQLASIYQTTPRRTL